MFNLICFLIDFSANSSYKSSLPPIKPTQTTPCNKWLPSRHLPCSSVSIVNFEHVIAGWVHVWLCVRVHFGSLVGSLKQGYKEVLLLMVLNLITPSGTEKNALKTLTKRIIFIIFSNFSFS